MHSTLCGARLGTAAHGQYRESNATSRKVEPTFAPSANVPTGIDNVAQEQTMTEERKHEQRPWYPTIERMPEIHNVEDWQNRSVEENPVLLEGGEAEENEPVTGDVAVHEAVGSTAPVAPNKPAKE
jgi:hypothetical protein